MLPHDLTPGAVINGLVASHSWLDLHVRTVLFLSDSHEHSFTDFDRPSIPSCVDLWECLVLTKRECVYIICHRRMPETSILHGLPSQHTTPLYFVRCYFLSDWTFLVCL